MTNKWPTLLVIASLPFLLLGLIHPFWFGHSVDWLNQHVILGSVLSKQPALLPKFIPHFAGGVNGYLLAYYGSLRPDVLLEHFFPQLPDVWVFTLYQLISMSVAGCLCWWWLTKHQHPNQFAFAGACLLIFSTYFFQAHKQVMFVDYLPWLLLAFLGVDHLVQTKQISLLIIANLGIMVHSYFFAPACALACLLYFLSQTKEVSLFWRWLLAYFITFLSTAIFTLPIVHVLLEHHKDVAPTVWSSLFYPDLRLKALIYSPYGCGLPYIAWCGLVLSLKQKHRFLAAGLMVIILFPLAWYLLSGTLYARPKIVLAFLPLIIMLCVSAFEKPGWPELWQWGLFLLPLLWVSQLFVWLEASLLFLLLLYPRWARWPVVMVCLACIVCLWQNPPSSFIDRATWQKSQDPDLLSLIHVASKQKGRLAILSNFPATNLMEAPRASGYGSLMPSDYNHFVFDDLHMNIASNNRTAIKDEVHPLYLLLMGIRQLITTSGQNPMGYHLEKRQGSYRLLESKSARPMAYLSTQFISQRQFNQLNLAQKLIALQSYTLTNDPVADVKIPLPKSYSLPDLTIQNNHKSHQKLILPHAGQLILITCQVTSYQPDKKVIVSINHQQNQLSSINDPYDNQNHHFSFCLNQAKATNQLHLTLSKGHYRLSHWKLTYLPWQPQPVQEVKMTSLSDGWTFRCHLQHEATLVTSIPNQQGFTAMDGHQKIKITPVNRAFVGFRLKKGEHTLRLRFEPPYRLLGSLLTGFGLLVWMIDLIYERRFYA